MGGPLGGAVTMVIAAKVRDAGAERARRLRGVFGPLGNWEFTDFLSIVETLAGKRNTSGLFLAGQAAAPLKGGGFSPRQLVCRHHPESLGGPQSRGRGETWGCPAEGCALLPPRAVPAENSCPARTGILRPFCHGWGPETRPSGCKAG